MQINLPDPPLGRGIPVFGNEVSPNEFQGVLPHGLFKNLVPDPKRLEGAGAKHNPDLSGVANVRARIQRLINGAKRRNVEPYAKYMINMVKSGEGFTPQIVLWSEQKLRVEHDEGTGLAWALVPHEQRFVALDGDTQTTARNLADVLAPGLFDKERIKVVLKHGIPEDQAQQIFADCNSQGVKVSTSMAIGLDNRDDATQLAKQIEKDVPRITGKVNRQKRQLSGKDEDLITMSAFRGSVVCFVQGIGGVQFQTKNVEISLERHDLLREAGALWYSIVLETLGFALRPEARAENFASAPAVWAAIGALGYETYRDLLGDDFDGVADFQSVEAAFRSSAEAYLKPVDWRRLDHWQTAGAKKSSTGAVTLGGPKEAGTLVYKAIKDKTLSPQFQLEQA